MRTIQYRGCTLTETSTTTEGYRRAFGRYVYHPLLQVWSVSGRLSKDACRTPFLTSATACREWVREQDAQHEYLVAQLNGEVTP